MHRDHQGRSIVLFLQIRFAVDERLELLHPIEDRLNTHPGALPVLMKRGNSILAAGCPRVRSFPSKAVSSPVRAPTDSAEEPGNKTVPPERMEADRLRTLVEYGTEIRHEGEVV